jgi:hypothetical protein
VGRWQNWSHKLRVYTCICVAFTSNIVQHLIIFIHQISRMPISEISISMYRTKHRKPESRNQGPDSQSTLSNYGFATFQKLVCPPLFVRHCLSAIEHDATPKCALWFRPLCLFDKHRGTSTTRGVIYCWHKAHEGVCLLSGSHKTSSRWLNQVKISPNQFLSCDIW